MPAFIGYELGNSCPPIPAETWKHDGVLPQILGRLVVEKRQEMGVEESDTSPVSAEEIIGILSDYADEVEAS
jgi:hypothetical protein